MSPDEFDLFLPYLCLSSNKCIKYKLSFFQIFLMVAHCLITMPNPPMHMSSTPVNFSLLISSKMWHNNGRPSNKVHIIHSMDVSCLSQEDMSPPGPSGVGVGTAYGYHPSSIPHHIVACISHHTIPSHHSSAIPFNYHHPQGHYRLMNYPPTHSIPPYPDPALHAAVSSSPPPTAAWVPAYDVPTSSSSSSSSSSCSCATAATAGAAAITIPCRSIHCVFERRSETAWRACIWAYWLACTCSHTR